jgi:DNA adenine methylase
VLQIEKIEKITKYKDRIVVLNEDGKRVFSRYAKQKNTFIYLDPPYIEKGNKLYFNALKKDDHNSLEMIVNEQCDAKWLMTYDQVEHISNIYADRKQYAYQLRYTAQEKRDATELMICSDSIASYINQRFLKRQVVIPSAHIG